MRSCTPVTTAAAALVLLLGACGPRAAPAVNVDREGVAIHGYDPVAYFTAGRPRRGLAEHAHEWRGATWRFSSVRHRDLFAEDPDAYAPRYGGYCAYGVSRGSLVDIDPEAWTIHEGTLYLNVSRKIRTEWSTDIPGFVATADRNWPGLIGER